ncbi:hypothetical protein N7517_005222, partial [Penicillium concentricum]
HGNSQEKKLAHWPKRSQRRTALLVKLLEPITSGILLFGADIPCNATGTSERHETPFRMCLLSYWMPRWRSGMIKSVSSRGAFGEKPDPLSELQFLPMSSSLSCEDAENLMSRLQSLKPSLHRTVEACDIYLPDDSLAANGVQGYCQPSPEPRHQTCAG